MAYKGWLVFALCVFAAGCGGDDKPTTPNGHAADAGADDDAGACATGQGTGTLQVDIAIDDGVEADIRITRAAGDAASEPLRESGSRSLSSGAYRISAHRVRKTSDLVGPAFQGAVAGSPELCVVADKTTHTQVTYTREPGSQRMWLTQSNGDGAQVQGFDGDQLASRGDQTPSVSLSPHLNNVGPIRVDGKGRLWVGTNTGTLVAYDAAQMASTSSDAPAITLEGSSLCEDVVPCGPTAIAFDAKGALWVATLHRIVALAPASIDRSGQPSAAVTIASSDAHNPRGLAFDHAGNLWVADAEGALAKFNAARLDGDISGAADTVIFAQQPGPVMLGLGEPEGLVVDADDNIWVGYFAGNDLVRFSKSERAASALVASPIIPALHIKIGVEALVTDLALDEAGNLWLPGGAGAVYRIAKAELSSDTPALDSLRSAETGSVEKLTFNTVPGPSFIAP